MKKYIVLVLIGLLSAGALNAATHPYREGGLSFTFPDSWRINDDEEILEATSPDGQASVYISIIYDAEDIAAALEIYQDDLLAIMDDFTPDAPGKDVLINGLKAHQLHGRANIDTLIADVGVHLIETSKGVVLLVRYRAANSEKDYAAEFDAIVHRLKKL